MEIKCIITDDEPIARKGLRRHIGKIDFLTIVGECEDAIQLNNMLNSVQADLLFLDIEMPDMSGLDFLESAQNTPKVIITSAYERYALRGYEFDVVDYLLKPISFSRFLKSVNKAHALMESTSKSEEPAYIFVKTERQLKRLYLKVDSIYRGHGELYCYPYPHFQRDRSSPVEEYIGNVAGTNFYASAPLFHRESFLCTSDRRKSINHWGA